MRSDVSVDGVHFAKGDERKRGELDGAFPEITFGGGEELDEVEACGFEVEVGVDEVLAAGGEHGVSPHSRPLRPSGGNVRYTSAPVRELAWNPTYAVDADDDSVWVAAGPRHVSEHDIWFPSKKDLRSFIIFKRKWLNSLINNKKNPAGL